MAPKTISHRIVLTFALLLLVSATFIPYYSVSADALTSAPSVPDINSFVLSVNNGDGTTPRGVYADGAFALPIVQQPASNPGYVSIQLNVVTQFGMASSYGNVGLLAHNTLSGQYFFTLIPGDRIRLVYGDGRIENFKVTNIYSYQATSPSSTSSDFIDLSTNERLTASQLFNKVYTGPRHITFQTCIAANGNSSWGRLFVIAEPEPETYYYISSGIHSM